MFSSFKNPGESPLIQTWIGPSFVPLLLTESIFLGSQVQGVDLHIFCFLGWKRPPHLTQNDAEWTDLVRF